MVRRQQRSTGAESDWGFRGGRERGIDNGERAGGPVADTCWWCGAQSPLSAEHKFTRTDLRRVRGEDEGKLSWLGSGRVREIRSDKKSGVVRFGKSLCRSCNDTRSQPFDRAYDRCAEYLWARPLWNPRRIDLRTMFPEGRRADAANLGRYVVKHLACRMVDDGLTVPQPSAISWMAVKSHSM
jgi:hypothetical protein